MTWRRDIYFIIINYTCAIICLLVLSLYDPLSARTTSQDEFSNRDLSGEGPASAKSSGDIDTCVVQSPTEHRSSRNSTYAKRIPTTADHLRQHPALPTPPTLESTHCLSARHAPSATAICIESIPVCRTSMAISANVIIASDCQPTPPAANEDSPRNNSSSGSRSSSSRTRDMGSLGLVATPPTSQDSPTSNRDTTASDNENNVNHQQSHPKLKQSTTIPNKKVIYK